MPKVALYNQAGSQVGEIELADNVFGIEPNNAVLFDAIVMQQASQRQGTHDVKNRSEVRGGGRKPWRQKGTGRARQGSIRAPQWKGGGVVFGPTPRKYGFKLNRKVRRLALRSALSSKVQNNELLVLDALNIATPKTKDMVSVLNNLKVDRKVLIVTTEFDQNVALSSRNIPGTKFVDAAGINVLDLVSYDKVIVTKEAIAKVEEVLA